MEIKEYSLENYTSYEDIISSLLKRNRRKRNKRHVHLHITLTSVLLTQAKSCVSQAS